MKDLTHRWQSVAGATLTIPASNNGPNTLIVIDWLCVYGVNAAAADEWFITVDGATLMKQTVPASESAHFFFSFPHGYPIWDASGTDSIVSSTVDIVLGGADSGQGIICGYRYLNPAQLRL